MKVKVTLITQNDVPVSILGENPEQKIKNSWDLVLLMLNQLSTSNDTCRVESVEIMEE